MSIEALFSNPQYIEDEIIRMREAWGSRKTFTKETIDASRKTLAFMHLYAPESMFDIVDASLYELERRESLMLFEGLTI